MESYGMNTQEGGSMCQVLREHAQTLGTTHRGGGNGEAYGFSSYNQDWWNEVSQTIRLPIGADSYAKVIVRYE